MQVGDHLPEAAWKDQPAVCTAVAACGEAPCLLALSRHTMLSLLQCTRCLSPAMLSGSDLQVHCEVEDNCKSTWDQLSEADRADTGQCGPKEHPLDA